MDLAEVNREIGGLVERGRTMRRAIQHCTDELRAAERELRYLEERLEGLERYRDGFGGEDVER